MIKDEIYEPVQSKGTSGKGHYLTTEILVHKEQAPHDVDRELWLKWKVSAVFKGVGNTWFNLVMDQWSWISWDILSDRGVKL